VKVRVAYSVTVDDDYRRAIRLHQHEAAIDDCIAEVGAA
jgi:hypothetical protein